MLSPYRLGSTPLHRWGAGPKLAAVAIFSLTVSAFPLWPVLAGGAALILVGYASAHFTTRDAYQQVHPLRWLLLIVLIGYAWGGDWAWERGWLRGLALVASIVLVVWAASLLTLTTRLLDLVDTIAAMCRPLARLGVRPATVGLVLSLAITMIPVLLRTAREVREAQQARGMERSWRAFLTPLMLRTIRHADHVGQALQARGVDDDVLPTA